MASNLDALRLCQGLSLQAACYMRDCSTTAPLGVHTCTACVSPVTSWKKSCGHKQAEFDACMPIMQQVKHTCKQRHMLVDKPLANSYQRAAGTQLLIDHSL